MILVIDYIILYSNVRLFSERMTKNGVKCVINLSIVSKLMPESYVISNVLIYRACELCCRCRQVSRSRGFAVLVVRY